MASESPASILFGFDGSGYTQIGIRAGIAVPSGQPGFMALGSDGTNTRYLRTASDGTLRVDPTGTTTQPVHLSSDKNLDGFGRLVTASPQTVFDSKMLFDNQPLHWDDQQISGSGTSSTFNTNQASVTLAVSASTAGVRVRQTFSRFGYQSGKSQGAVMTGILGAPATGITRRLGLFDASNGIFFESSPTTIRVVRRSFTTGSAVDTGVNQADWNLDKMDGTGVSGIALDFTKTQIFMIQYQWLGTGSIWYGFNINGATYWAHRMDGANVGTTVSLSNPNLPIRFEISNSGAGGAASLLQICATVFSNGGLQDVGVTRAIYRNTAFSALNTSDWFPLIAIRLRSGFAGALLRIKKLSINCQSTADYTWRLVLNPTVVGTAFSFTPLSNSSLEFDAATTNATTVTGGTDIDADTTQQSTSGNPTTTDVGELRIGSSIAGTSDVIVLAVRRETGVSETYSATITFSEQV